MDVARDPGDTVAALKHLRQQPRPDTPGYAEQGNMHVSSRMKFRWVGVAAVCQGTQVEAFNMRRTIPSWKRLATGNV